jgi:hypothetical protein
MTRSELIEAMARAMIGNERYDALPGISSYLERKSAAVDAEWRDRADLHGDMEAALSAIEPIIAQAFRDGLAYGNNVAQADPDLAWQQSRIRVDLESGRLK